MGLNGVLKPKIKNVVRTEKKNTKMEFEAQAAVICGLIVTLLMLDFETLKKKVGKLTHYVIFRSVNLLKCGFRAVYYTVK